jgi:hypothetical protein
MTKHKLGLGAAVGLLAAVATVVFFASAALAATGASVSTGTADANGAATVTISMEAPSGGGVGNWAFDVGFDPTKYTADPTCTAAQGDVTVKPAGVANVIRFGGFAGGSGLTGTTAIGTCNFKTNLTAGACSDLTIKIADAPGAAFQDATGTDIASPTFTAGKVCAAAAATTAAATTAAASAAATTAAALPNTGGQPSDSSLSAGWLAAAAGLLIVVAAGAWTFARAREDN